jgi:NitT/TauT family transport system ATP-binding protein
MNVHLPLQAGQPIDAPVIVAEAVGKTYSLGTKPIRAVEDISLSVAPGQFVSLVGPSGCGKSTLLEMLGGLMPPTTGSIAVDGAPLIGPMPDKIAIVFQDAMLLPWKTVLSNVEFPLEIQGRFSAAERRRRALDMIELVGLKDFAQQLPHELSGGMKQRASIARGLVQDPRIILMDEPFGALDEQTRIHMGQELLRIWQETQRTIVLITHSLTEAIYLSDTVLVMGSRPGRIVERLEVDLPRPRQIEMMGSEAFGRMRNRVWQLLTANAGPSPEAAK